MCYFWVFLGIQRTIIRTHNFKLIQNKVINYVHVCFVGFSYKKKMKNKTQG